MMELHQSYGEAVHFIRFNPDKFNLSTTGKSGYIELPKRHEVLFQLLKRLLREPAKFFGRFPGLSVRYMYYDGCDQEEHFVSKSIEY
jgi:hypothetical protein